MGDIDFDELDKAVNSLMNQATGQTKAEPSVSGAPEPASDDSSDALAQSAEPVVSASAPAPRPVARPGVAEGPAPAIARRSTGRFMDVIPSGSRSAAPHRPAPSTAASRESAPLNPIQAPTQPPVEPESQPQSAPEAPVVELVPAPVLSEQPDIEPIDQFIENSVESTPSEPEATPLSSPFLEGIAIDKRPLGSGSSPVVGDPNQSDSVSADTPQDAQGDTPMEPDAATDGFVAEPSTSTEPLSPELSPELLAIDAMPIGPDEASAATGQSEEVESAPAPAEVTKVPAPKPTTSPVQGQIAPQYNATPTETPEPSAVFDAASEVPQQLTHPPKKKSGWSIVVWIVLMVLIGIGGGVAAWYFLLK